jgi:hypothetical protein
MTNYPKALEEFLESVPSELRNEYEKVKLSETFKKMLSDLPPNLEVMLSPYEDAQDTIGGVSEFPEGKPRVLMNGGFLKNPEKYKTLFVQVLNHELGHIVQGVKIAKAKNLPISRDAIFYRDKKEDSRYIIRECNTDRKSLDMIEEVGLNKNNPSFNEVKHYFTEKYGKDIKLNMSYSEMKSVFAKFRDNLVLEAKKKDKANNVFDEYLQSVEPNFEKFLYDKEVINFEKMMLTGKDFSRTPLSKEEVVIKKQENKSKRDIEQAKINNEGRRTALNRFKNGVREEERVNNPLLKARKHGRE